MSASPREFLLVVQESAFKTPVAAPAVWTTATTYGLANYQAAYVRLDGGNAFTARSRPVGTVEIPYGGGRAIGAYRTSDKQEIKGKLQLKLTVGQAPFWLSWAFQQVNAGQTAPWATTEPAGDLASCTVYHAKQQFGGTFKRTGYYGGKVDAARLSVSEQSTVATLDLDLSFAYQEGNQFDGSVDPTATAFPAPADNNFPVDPYVFIHAGGANFVTYNGVVRTQFTDMTFEARNTLARAYFANRYIQMLRWMGRDTSLALRNLYVSEADRTAYEGQTSAACSIEINNGTHGFTLGLNAQNVLDPLEDDLKLDDLYFQGSTSNNLWDPTAGSDFTLTIT